MFEFDRWAEWLSEQVNKLESSSFVSIRHHDTRVCGETKLNPSFGLNLDSIERIGFISFWKNGLCDLHVVDVQSGLDLVNEAGIETDDENVAKKWCQFLSFYDVA